MNQKELKELIEFLIEKDIAEFELERGDVKVRIKRGADAQAAPVISHITAAPSAARRHRFLTHRPCGHPRRRAACSPGCRTSGRATHR